MLEVRGKKLSEKPLTILKGIRQHIYETQNVEVMNKMSESGSNIMCTCPFPHEKGYERNPSFGISLQPIVINGERVGPGIVHCFTCGYSGTLDKMISDLMFLDDGGSYGYNWLLQNYTISATRHIEVPTFGKQEESDTNYVSNEQTAYYRGKRHEYMYERGLTNEVMELYDVGYDDIHKCITFPVRDKKGNTLFISRRGVETKWFNNPHGTKKSLYGVYELPRDVKEVYIVESFIDTLLLRKWGYWGVALMGTGTHEQYEMLNELPVRSYIIATDNDRAGNIAAEKLLNILRPTALVYTLMLPDGCDVGDMQEQEFNELEKVLR